MKLVNVQEMKQLDQLATAEYAVPGILLMDNAAQAVADAVNDSLDELDGESVVVFCGGGNNGGDGFGCCPLAAKLRCKSARFCRRQGTRGCDR